MNTPDSCSGPGERREALAEPFRVLLVEDNPINQRLMRRLLEGLNCQVEVAANGREAVSKFAPGRYELAFMDCHMPVMDGYDATAAIRQADPSDRTPIIAVTASVVPSDHERCRQVGMNGVITKPVDPEEIRGALLRWCRRPENARDPLAPRSNLAA